MTNPTRRRTDFEWRIRNLARSRLPRLTELYRRHGSLLVARDRRHPRFSRWARSGLKLRHELGTQGIVFEASGIWIRDEHGLEWSYDPDMWLSALGKELGLAYDLAELRYVRDRLRPGGTFIDVGAHIGGYSLPIASSTSEVQIHAFEPVPETRAMLERNLARNSLTDKVTVWPQAVADHQGKRRISITFGGANHLIAGPHDHVTGIEVEVVTLDRALLDICPRVDVLKCDVEGAELEALRGAEQLLRRDQPDLVLEFDSELTRRSGQDAGALVAYLTSLGYRAASFLEPSRLTDPETAAASSPARNVLFTASS